MLKVWIKSVLWAAILTNVIAAGRLERIHLGIAKEAGGFLALVATLCILLTFGIILGSIYFGIRILIIGKEKIIQRKPTNRYCIGLAITLILVAFVGNLAALILAGCYLLVSKIVRKFRKR